MSISSATGRPCRLSEAINALLRPHAVAVVGAERARPISTRGAARSARHYRYRIVNRRAPLALERGRAWRVKPRLDAAAMHEAAQALIGRHDFSTFRDSQCQAKSPRAHARPARRRGARATKILFDGERALVPASPGALDGGLAGRGRRRAAGARTRSGPRSRPPTAAAAARCAAGHGLYLVRVDYAGACAK